jgi:DNA-directed RNA polymerase subunit beta'
VGGAAAGSSEENNIKAKHSGKLEIEDLRVVKRKLDDGTVEEVVVSRSAEMKILEEGSNITLASVNIPYGSKLFVKPGTKVSKGDKICEWDLWNSVIISEVGGKIDFDGVVENLTYRDEMDEQTGYTEKVIIESRDKRLNPSINIVKGKDILRNYSLPVGAHIAVEAGAAIGEGQILAKIPRMGAGRSGDITGGLPRVTELFEARNPSNPAIVSEVDGIVSYGKIKRGNREIVITPRAGEPMKYLVPLSKHILVQENDFVRAGAPLSDGAITPADILAIEGPTAVQEYLVNEIQEVYRLQGVKINDKHFEVIVRQMMRKVIIEDQGDTRFLEKQSVDKVDFMEENDLIFGKKVVLEPGDSDSLKAGMIISARKLRDENSRLRRQDKKLVETRDAIPATSRTMLQGITRASLQTKSFISAASFQETTKVLNEAAVSGKVDDLLGLKENVIVGHLIPAGTGVRRYHDLVVANKEDLEALKSRKMAEEEIGD